MIDQEQQRDYAEEAYWRNHCPACDYSPCRGGGLAGSCEGEQPDIPPGITSAEMLEIMPWGS